MLVGGVVVPATSAKAQPVDDLLDRGWYLYALARFEEADASASDLLRKNPHCLEAHSLHQRSGRAMGDDEALTERYRKWCAVEPDNEFARVALAMFLAMSHEEFGDLGEEILALLDPLPDHPRARFWALDTMRRLGSPLDDEEQWVATTRAMCTAAEDSGEGRLQRRGAVLRLLVKTVDTEQSSAARKAVRRQPTLIAELAHVLWPVLPDGPTAAGLRFFAVKQAENALQVEDPVRLLYASTVFWAQGDKEGQQQCSNGLADADPAWAEIEFHPLWHPVARPSKRTGEEPSTSESGEPDRAAPHPVDDD